MLRFIASVSLAISLAGGAVLGTTTDGPEPAAATVVLAADPLPDGPGADPAAGSSTNPWD